MTFPWAVPIVAVLLTAGFLLVVDYADDSEGEDEGFTSERVGNDVTVRGCGELYWASAWDGLMTLTIIPEGGEVDIHDNAFLDKDTLLSVTIQGSVGSIGDDAFYDCNTLSTFTVQGSVGPVGGYAFYWCGSLSTFTVQGSVGSIGNHAFWGCGTLSTFTIPNSVDSIGNSAFRDCDTLSTFTVQGSVGSIGNNAFYDCNTLSTFTVQGSVGSIGENAFFICNSLSTVTITGPITSIEDGAFTACTIKTVNVACNYALDLETGSTDYGGIALYATAVNHVHRYSATYNWADDGSACTVHISCENESAPITNVQPAVTHTVKVQPTCTAMGTTTYSVSGTYAGFNYTDSKDVVDIAALGHDLVHHAGQPPTATEPGWNEYDTCSVCDYTTYTEIPATGGSGDGNGNDTLIYISAAGAIAAAILIGAAFVILRTRRER